MFSLLKYFIVENVIHIYSEIIKHSHSYILFHPPTLASPATPHSELHVVFDNALSPVSAAYLCVGVGSSTGGGNPTRGHILSKGLFSFSQHWLVKQPLSTEQSLESIFPSIDNIVNKIVSYLLTFLLL